MLLGFDKILLGLSEEVWANLLWFEQSGQEATQDGQQG
jgi:hypothetical protein